MRCRRALSRRNFLSLQYNVSPLLWCIDARGAFQLNSDSQQAAPGCLTGFGETQKYLLLLG